MFVINRIDRVEIEAHGGAIYIRQTTVTDADDVIELWPEHIDSICEALQAAKKEAQETPDA